MNKTGIPTLEEFLAAPLEEVVKVAPVTAVYGAGGTRRRAVFEGIEPWSDEFGHWSRERMLSRINLIFHHGVRNLFVTTLTPDMLRENNRYRSQLIERTNWFIAGDEALNDYKYWGWRVRLVGADDIPEMRTTAEYLKEVTSTQYTRTLYWNIMRTENSHWEQLFVAAHSANKPHTRAEMIQALYGENIPPVTLYLAFGKPTILPEVVPPLLMGQVQCYWSQQPGYTLTERQLRTILYDYAYLRSTWRDEKLERAKEALAHRQAWEEGPILGLGMRLGPFWYPAPITSSAWSTE